MVHSDLTNSLKAHSRSIKIRFLKMYREANAGHVGTSLSCAEILTFVRFAWMEEADDFILSKGHAAAALYSLLAEAGDLTESDIATFYQEGTFLAAHPPPNYLPHSPFATGSLGHGLSLAAGLAFGRKLQKDPSQVFCVTSDGELNEGSTWEAALFAAHHSLSQLVWLIDRNRLQGFGRTEEVMKLEPLPEKLRAFGWEVAIANAHEFPSLLQAKEDLLSRKDSQKPKVLICDSKKGRGWLNLEDTVDCHYLPMTAEHFEKLLGSLENEDPNA